MELIDESEFFEIFPQNIKPGNSNHYWELVSNLMMRLKFPFSIMETNEQGLHMQIQVLMK